MIDPFKELKAEDVLILYWFYTVHKKNRIKYEEFIITESLINEYNTFVKKWEKKYNDEPKYYKTVDWDIKRKKTDYYQSQLQDSAAFQKFIENEFKKHNVDIGSYSDLRQYDGENQFGIEIKNDKMHRKTGNLYIEYQERLRSDGMWVDSGILKKDNSKYYLIGDENDYYIFLKKRLVDIYRELKSGKTVEGCRLVEERAHQTSKGYTMKKTVARIEALACSVEDLLKITDEVKEKSGK